MAQINHNCRAGFYIVKTPNSTYYKCRICGDIMEGEKLKKYYQAQIVRYKSLADKCARPDRVAGIIETYRQELLKLEGQHNLDSF